MFEIKNETNTIYLWDCYLKDEVFIGNDKDLIDFLAINYRRNFCFEDFYKTGISHWYNPYIDNYLHNEKDFSYGKRYQFFDAYGRCINPKDYEREAYALFLDKYKDKGNYFSLYNFQIKKASLNKKKVKKFSPRFRVDPVPHTRKHRGGPWVRPRRVARLHRMYQNPDYKGFNRGSEKEVPEGWWDDFYRHREKCWKSQRKTRHQWKEK